VVSRGTQYQRQWLDGLIAAGRPRRRSRWVMPIAMGCAVGALLSFAVQPLLERRSGIQAPAPKVGAMPVCSGASRAGNRGTCLVDGDTGWELGVKWRLKHVDTPELTSPESQLELQTALRARDRLRQVEYRLQD
jgi:hypothetical protein